MTLAPHSAPHRTLTSKRKAEVSPQSNVSKKCKGGRKSSEKKRSGNKSGPRFSTSKIRRYGKVCPMQNLRVCGGLISSTECLYLVTPLSSDFSCAAVNALTNISQN